MNIVLLVTVDRPTANVSQSELVLRENKLGNKKLPLLGEAINYANWILEFACVEL